MTAELNGSDISNLSCHDHPSTRLRGHHLQRHVVHVVQPVDRVPVGAGDEVPVDVDRRLDRGMAHLFLDIMQGFALGKQQAGESVPDIVEPETW